MPAAIESQGRDQDLAYHQTNGGSGPGMFWSRWENGYVESFIGEMRDELLNGEVLTSWGRLKRL